jgi:flagellar biosynthesis protein FlhG
MDQAQYLRQCIEGYKKKKQAKAARQTRVIAVASGKGGVGKTNFSVNLAIALKEMGHNTAVLDADLGLANVDVIIGMAPHYNLYDVIYNNKKMEDIVMEGPLGIKVIPGGSGIETLSNLSDLQREKLSEEFDHIKDTQILIVDTSAGLSKNVLGFMAVADDVIIVTTPEPTSITDAYSLIKVSLKYIKSSKFHIVVNKASGEYEAGIAYQRLGRAVKSFLNKEMDYLGYIADDSRVRKAVMEQTPFKILYPDCTASRCIDDIACTITGLSVPLKKAGGIKDFFSKMSILFSRLD